jgi:hypothetical protein
MPSRVGPLPRRGSVFLDARGGDRALRVSWHDEEGLLVLSLWRGNVCAGSFRLEPGDLSSLIATLRDAERRTTPLSDAG